MFFRQERPPSNTSLCSTPKSPRAECHVKALCPKIGQLRWFQLLGGLEIRHLPNCFFWKIKVITPSTSMGRCLYSTNYHSTTIFTFSQNSSLTLKSSKKPLSFLLKALHTKSLWQFWSEVLVGWICDSNRNIKWMYQQVTSHVTNNTILTLYWLNTDVCKSMFGKISQIEAGTNSFVGC